MRFTVKLEFKLSDLWVGVFWVFRPNCFYPTTGWRLDLLVCLLPCLPIHVVLHK